MARVEIWKDDKLIHRQVLDPAGENAGWWIRLAPHARVLLRIGESSRVGEYEARILESAPNAPDPSDLKPASHDDSLPELDVSPCEADDSGELPDGPSRTQTAHGPATQADLPADLESTTTLPGPPSTPSPKQRIGTGSADTDPAALPEIEGYRVIEKIGEGGMGTVWRAVQLGTKQEVALKLMAAHAFGSARAQARFEREVELAARLNHPNIARVYDSGLHRGLYYCAMELIDGAALDVYVRERKLTQRQTLDLMRNVCQAVRHAHQRGVIHRDLKPSNILVTEDGQPHVLDFGLAKSVLAKDSRADGSTMPGQVAGTPAYMSPEQAAGRVEEIDTRTDVYSLGVILYELLTARHPHNITADVPLHEALRRIIHQDAHPLRLPDRRTDKDLALLGRTALARDPELRFATAGDLARDISHYLTGRPLLAHPPSIGYVLRKFARRNWARLTAAASFLAILLALAVFSYIRIAEERFAAVQAGKREARQRERAEDRARAAIVAREEANHQRDRAEQEKRNALAAKQAEADQRRRAEAEVYRFGISEADRLSLTGRHTDAKELLTRLNPSLRGWESGHLVCRSMRRNFSEVLTLKGHSESVSSVAFSPDGKRLASGSRDKTIRLWDTATGSEVLVLKGHSESVSSVTFSPDGKRLASGSSDKTIKLWDTDTGRELLTLKGHSDSVRSVAFSPDGKRLASGGGVGDKTIRLWDTATDRELLTIEGHFVGVTSVAFSPDGKRLASGGIYDKKIKFWDTATGGELLTLKGHSSSVDSVVFSPDGKRLASGSHDDTIMLWDTATGRELLTLKGHSGAVRSITFSPDGKRLASGGWGGFIKLWDTDTGRELLTLKGHSSYVYSVVFSPDGKRLASGSGSDRYDESIKLWDLTIGIEVLTLNGHSKRAYSITFSPDGKRLASGSSDKTIKLWDLTTGSEVLTLKGHSESVNSVAFSPDGKRLASGSSDGTIKLWDMATGALQ